MALSVNSQSAPFQSTQSYLVTGTIGDTVTASFNDITVAKVSPVSAVLTAGGVTFTVTRLSTVGGASTLTFKDTTDGEKIDVTVNMTGDPTASPNPISGQVGQTITVTVSETNDPNAFASLTIDDTTVASLTITSNAEGTAVLSIVLLANGQTFLQVDDGHFGTLAVQILVGSAAPTKNLTIAACEAVIGGTLVSMPQTVIPLLDSVSGYNLSGGYTISLTQDKTYVVTYGIAPAESPTQINVANIVLRPTGQIFTADSRTLQVTALAVNSTIAFSPFSDGSYLKDGVVTVRSLAQDVLDKFSTVDSGPTEPANPREGELFFNTTTNTFEIFDSGSWIPISLGGFSGGLSSLTDVSITSPTNDQALQYNTSAGKWENQNLTVTEVAALPTAGATNRGQMVRVLGNGTTTADAFYICRQRADGTYIWSRFQGRAFRMKLCSADFTPSATGTDLGGLSSVPYDLEEAGSISIAWTVVRMRFRVETSGSSTSSVKLQRSTGTGIFANAGYLNTTSLDLTSGVYENSVGAFAVGTVNSGDKILPEYTALGTGAAGFTLYLDLRES